MKILHRHALAFSVALSLFNIGQGQQIDYDSLYTHVSPSLSQSERKVRLNELVYAHYRDAPTWSKKLALEAVSIKSPNLEATIDAYINIGRCYRTLSHFDSAHYFLDKALAESIANQYSTGQIKALNNKGAAYLRQGELEQAKGYFSKMLAVSKEVNARKEQANGYNNLAIIYRYSDDLPNANRYLDSAGVFYRLTGDSVGLARSLTNRGIIYANLNQPKEAITILFQALELQGLLNLQADRAATLNEIGLQYLIREDYEAAGKAFRESQVIHKQIGNYREQIISLQNLGGVYEQQGQLDSAATCMQLCADLMHEISDSVFYAEVCISLGQWYSEKPQTYELASTYFSKAESILTGTKSFEISALYDGKGYLALKQKKPEQAILFYQKELELAEGFEDFESLQYALKGISNAYRQLNKPTQVLYYSDLYHEVRDSLVNENSRETINRLHIAYESEQKDRQNLALQRNVAEQKLALSEQRNQRNVVLGLGALLILVGGGLFWRYRIRQQARLLAEQRKLELERERQAQLAALDAMKSRFFANISHEFRTPLTLILGQNEALQQRIDDPALDGKFEMVDRNGQRLLGLINQVLDLAKLEEGKLALAAKNIDLIPFIKNLFYSFESLADQKQIKLIYRGPERSLPAAVDPEKLERILFNLLSNAFKFTPQNGEISLIIQEQEAGIRIGIQDNGSGISAEKLARIFDRFYQVGEKDTPGNPGTGIGLALARELAELHGGTLKAESQPGKGSHFWLELPADLRVTASSGQGYAPHLEPVLALDTAPEAAHAAGATPAKGERILVAEDNPDVRAYLKDRLEGFGYQVSLAANGQEGLRQALKDHPDLILSDVMMPKMDGLEFAQAVRSKAEISHIPLILLTAKASEESKLSGLETGVDAYLTKPFNSRELQLRIRNLIQQRKQLRERFSEAVQIRPKEVSVVPMDQQFLQKLTEQIEAHMDDPQLGVEALSDVVGMSVTHLNRKLKALIGQSAGKLIRSMRMQRGAELLKKGAGNISEIAYDLGFQDPSHFTRSFKRHFGKAPSQWLAEENQSG